MSFVPGGNGAGPLRRGHEGGFRLCQGIGGIHEWILESQVGLPVKKSLEKMESEHPIDGAQLRAMMPWLKKE